jgi:uncharacterized protein (DUF302 family)
MIDRRAALAIAPIFVSLISLPAGAPRAAEPNDGGVVTVRSVFPFDETVRRIEADVADKKLMFFGAIEQAKLAAAAGASLNPSTLIVFGNPPLGAQFMSSKPQAGLDWPVRVLVTRDADGDVLVHYTDFAWIARRHRISDRSAAFAKAAEVIASIAASVAAQ